MLSYAWRFNRPLSGGEPALDVRQIPVGGPIVDLVGPPRHGCRAPADEGRWSFEAPDPASRSPTTTGKAGWFHKTLTVSASTGGCSPPWTRPRL